MVHIELTPDQAKLLEAVLDSCLRELRHELRHTDRRDYREMLKTQVASLQHLQQNLTTQSSMVAA